MIFAIRTSSMILSLSHQRGTDIAGKLQGRQFDNAKTQTPSTRGKSWPFINLGCVVRITSTFCRYTVAPIPSAWALQSPKNYKRQGQDASRSPQARSSSRSHSIAMSDCTRRCHCKTPFPLTSAFCTRAPVAKAGISSMAKTNRKLYKTQIAPDTQG